MGIGEEAFQRHLRGCLHRDHEFRGSVLRAGRVWVDVELGLAVELPRDWHLLDKRDVARVRSRMRFTIDRAELSKTVTLWRRMADLRGETVTASADLDHLESSLTECDARELERRLWEFAPEPTLSICKYPVDPPRFSPTIQVVGENDHLGDDEALDAFAEFAVVPYYQDLLTDFEVLSVPHRIEVSGCPAVLVDARFTSLHRTLPPVTTELSLIYLRRPPHLFQIQLSQSAQTGERADDEFERFVAEMRLM